MRPWTAWKVAIQVGGDGLQWGHGLAAVDGLARARASACVPWLQWGHGLAAVDGCAWRRNTITQLTLQWGHGLAAVDGFARV